MNDWMTERARVAYETANALLGGGVSWEEQSEVYRDAWRAAIAAIVPPADDALHSECEAAAAEARIEIRRLRDVIVSARWRLAKGRALWNGPCHECDAVLERGLLASPAPQEARDE